MLLFAQSGSLQIVWAKELYWDGVELLILFGDIYLVLLYPRFNSPLVKDLYAMPNWSPRVCDSEMQRIIFPVVPN